MKIPLPPKIKIKELTTEHIIENLKSGKIDAGLLAIKMYVCTRITKHAFP